MIIKIKLLHELAQVPLKFHSGDACWDCYATEIKDLGHNRYCYSLGFALDLPAGRFLDIRPRSSIYKTGMVLSNAPGTGDYGYTGEYKAIFYHVIPELPKYEVGDRVCQIRVGTMGNAGYDRFEHVDELTDSDRGVGGFGSTGGVCQIPIVPYTEQDAENQLNLMKPLSDTSMDETIQHDISDMIKDNGEKLRGKITYQVLKSRE